MALGQRLLVHHIFGRGIIGLVAVVAIVLLMRFWPVIIKWWERRSPPRSEFAETRGMRGKVRTHPGPAASAGAQGKDAAVSSTALAGCGRGRDGRECGERTRVRASSVGKKRVIWHEGAGP